MTLKEYLKLKITPYGKQPDLALIYQDLMNLGYSHKEIFAVVNEVLIENLNQILKDYENKKNEK